jgi:hypothetical protein
VWAGLFTSICTDLHNFIKVKWMITPLPSSNIENDLHINRMEFGIAIEDRYGIRLNAEEWNKSTTFRDIVFMLANVGKKG